MQANKDQENASVDPLRTAVEQWRQVEKGRNREAFSPGARANLLALSRSGADTERGVLASLFMPLGRLIAATALPALSLALLLGWLGTVGNHGTPENGSNLRVQVSKVNGQAVFAIANGGRVHQVYRSSSPVEIGRDDLYVTTDGDFRDSLSGGARVVFYRVD